MATPPRLRLESDGLFRNSSCRIISTGEVLPVIAYEIKHDAAGMFVVLTVPAHYVDIIIDTAIPRKLKDTKP